MKAPPLARIAVIVCLTTMIHGQNYIRLSRSDPNFGIARKIHMDQAENDGKPNNIAMPNKRALPLKQWRRLGLFEYLVPLQRENGYNFGDATGIPYQTGQKRTNYVRLAKRGYIRLVKKGLEYDKTPDFYDDWHYEGQ